MTSWPHLVEINKFYLILWEFQAFVHTPFVECAIFCAVVSRYHHWVANVYFKSEVFNSVCDFQAIPKSLISWFKGVWFGLEFNIMGAQEQGWKTWLSCFDTVNKYCFTQEVNKAILHVFSVIMKETFPIMGLVTLLRSFVSKLKSVAVLLICLIQH